MRAVSPQGDVDQERLVLARTVGLLDARALDVITRGVRGSIPSDDAMAELVLLAKDLKRCYQGILEVCERRDLNYEAMEQLNALERHCLWLFRKIQLERLACRKFDLEARLRGLISTEAFGLYEALVDAEAEEHSLLSSDPAALRNRLLAYEG